MSDAPQPPIVIRYHFRFADGRQQTFTAELDAESLQLRQPPRASYPDWTRLDHCKCATCPLSSAQTPRCPAATSLIDVVDAFNQTLSHEQVDVEVETKERRILKRCSVQEAVGSLIGVYMPTSGCPILATFRPMARFHLPFASAAETCYRALSMTLLAQHFQAKRGEPPTESAWTRLAALCREIQDVDMTFFKRLAPIVAEDAALNAIVRLHAQTNTLEFLVDEGSLDEVEQLFRAYWDRDRSGPAPAAP